MPGHKVPARPILTEPWREVNSMEALMEDFSEEVALGIKTTLEKCFQWELLEQLQTSWGKHNPGRVDYRNGYRYRSLQTRLGLIKDLKVPRSREGTYQSQILPRYKRYEAGVSESEAQWESFLNHLYNRPPSPARPRAGGRAGGAWKGASCV